MKFRIYAERAAFFVAEVEAESEADAREMADASDVDWEVDHGAHARMGMDDQVITAVETIEDEDGEDEDGEDEDNERD